MTTLTETIKKLIEMREEMTAKYAPVDTIQIETGRYLYLLDAAEKAERYEQALKYIAKTHYCYYDGNRPFISDHDSGYAMGVADGHRLASKWADEALAPEQPEAQKCEACNGSGRSF